MGVGLVGPWPLVVSQAVPLPSGPSGRGSLGPVRSRHGLPHGAGSTVRLQVGVVGWGPPELPPQGPRLLIAFLCPAVPPSCPAVASCLVGPWLGRSRVAHWPLSRPPAGLASPWPLLSLLSDPRGASFLPLLRSCHPSGSCRSPPPSLGSRCTPGPSSSCPRPVCPAGHVARSAGAWGVRGRLWNGPDPVVQRLQRAEGGAASPPGSCPLGRRPQGHLLPDWSSQVMVSLDHKGA